MRMLSIVITVFIYEFLFFSLAYPSNEINFTGKKTFSYETNSSSSNDELKSSSQFNQSLYFSLRGNILDNLTTNLTFNDKLPSKIENMEFHYFEGPFSMTVGDFNLKKSSLHIPESRLRGFRADYKTSNNKVIMFLSRPDSKLFTDIIKGDGERGPYFLATGQIVPETENLFRRDIKLIKNIDYVIDYSSGVVEFMDPLSVGEWIDVTCRVDDYNAAGKDYLFAIDSAFNMGNSNKLNLKLLRRENKTIENSDLAHTMIELGQTFRLSPKVNFTSSFAHMTLDENNITQNKDNHMNFLTTYSLTPSTKIKLKYDEYGDRYIPIYMKHNPFSKKFGLSFDYSGMGFLNEIGLYSIAGDELGKRNVLDGKLEYMKNGNLSIKSNYKIRQPDGENRLNYLTNINGSIVKRGIKIEGRGTIQDNMSLFSQNNGIETLNDGEIRISTSPRKKTIYLIESRKLNETLIENGERVKTNRKLRILHRFSPKTRLNSSLSYEKYDNIDGSNDSRNINSILTHKLSRKLTIDTSYSNIFRSGINSINGDGFKLGMKYSPMSQLRVISNVGIKRKDFRRFGKKLNLLSEDFRIAWLPRHRYILELIGRNEEGGIDQITGFDLGRRKQIGGKFTFKLKKGIKLLTDINFSKDRIPQSREMYKWNTELGFRIKDNMNFFINFYKLETVFPDKGNWDSINSKGSFRFEAKI